MNPRRKLLLALGAGALVPGLSFAQQPAKVWRIGYLSPRSVDPAAQEAIRRNLGAHGYVEGKNLAFEWRFADGRIDRLPELAVELARVPVDVILAAFTPSVFAARQATTSIPIVMASAGDPVGTGLIASLARPGGNITGLSATTAELASKSVELVREVFPSSKRVAVLGNPADPFSKPFLAQVQAAARALGLDLQIHLIREDKDFDAAYRAMVKSRVSAVVIQGSLSRQRSVDLALKHRIPAVSSIAGFAESGALLSYTPSFVDQHREAASYVDRIFKGARPAELPVSEPTKYELIVNLKTAKALRIRLPAAILSRADRVIE